MERRRLEILGIGVLLAALGCASHYRRQFDLYYRIEDWEGAEVVLEKAIAEDPDNPEVYRLLGEAYGHEGRYEEMNDAFGRSLALSGRYAAEIDQLRDYFVAVQLNRGIEDYNREDFGAAIDEFLRIDAIEREESRHLGYLGLSYSRIGEFEEAARYLELSAERNHDLDSKVELARVYAVLGDDRGVIGVAQDVLKGHPDRLDILRVLAPAYQQEGEVEKAIGTYEKILELSPSSPAARYNLALLLCRRDRRDEAIEILEGLAAGEPDSLEIRYSICSLLDETGRYEESLACFRDYLDLAPGDVRALNHLFVLNRRLNRWEEARRIKGRLEALGAWPAEGEPNPGDPREIPEDPIDPDEPMIR